MKSNNAGGRDARAKVAKGGDGGLGSKQSDEEAVNRLSEGSAERPECSHSHESALFAEPPPPMEECLICMIILPLDHSEGVYQPCCGKSICAGCVYGSMEVEARNMLMAEQQGREATEKKSTSGCPFCRAPRPGNREIRRRLDQRMEMNDPEAFSLSGRCYMKAEKGYPLDSQKAVELWLRAIEIDPQFAEAHENLGSAHFNGDGVEVDQARGVYYFERAAIAGSGSARYNLARIEHQLGRRDRSKRHMMIGAMAGDGNCLKMVREGYTGGLVTKDEFAKALRAHKESVDQTKSRQRDLAKERFC